MERSGMLRPIFCEIIPGTELHLKHILKYTTPPRNGINFLLATRGFVCRPYFCRFNSLIICLHPYVLCLQPLGQKVKCALFFTIVKFTPPKSKVWLPTSSVSLKVNFLIFGSFS